MLISAILEILSGSLPLRMAMADDPVGTQVMAQDRDIETIAVAYELDEEVIEAAVEAGAGLIVVFHPLIYPAISSITGSSRVERCLISLIDHRIALHVVHTVFDAHPYGTSRLLAEALGLSDITPLVPNELMPGWGMGAIGNFSEAIQLDEFAERLRIACDAPCVRLSLPAGNARERSRRNRIMRVAILGGSGISFYSNAVRAGAELLVTADVRYHAFHAANDLIPVADPGHAESETFVLGGLTNVIEMAIAPHTGDTPESLRVVALRNRTNPVLTVLQS